MFYKNVRRLCKERGITFGDVESGAGIGAHSITKFKDGTRYPTLKTLEKVANFFQVPITELVRESNDPESENN